MSDETIQKPFEIGEEDTHLIQIKKNKDHKVLLNTKVCCSVNVATLKIPEIKLTIVLEAFKTRFMVLVLSKGESLDRLLRWNSWHHHEWN